jgi:glyoxylase-like metal-dependent hydrolase (beta-lactamase superfamily II)
MAQQVPISQSAEAETQRQPDSTATITPDLSYRRLAIVNVVFLGRSHAGAGEWTLIDAGVMGTTPLIRSSAAERFDNAPPAAIVMRHGHFDHVAGLEALSREWNVPVYAHELELPYLNGAASYPPPDPTVGGGLMSAAAPLYPRGPVDVKERLQMLPADGSVPAMPGWRWIHTPGHTPGHVSFWRESDRCLIAGDAFITTAQESAYSVATQAPEMHGPPMYYTQDWAASRESVQRLAALEPETVITGHGPPMHGAQMRQALHELADRFDEVAVPHDGDYVANPTRPDDGSAYVHRY